MKKHPQANTYFLILMTILLSACRSGQDEPGKLVVINIRGTSFESLRTYTENHPEGYFADLIKGDEVKELVPVTNAVTATNLAAFETGTAPGQNGIIGHQFGHRQGDDLVRVSGFGRLYQSPSFLEQADESGKRVINIGSLLLHGATQQHQNLESIAQGQALSNPQVIPLDTAVMHIQVLNDQTLQINRSGDADDYGYSFEINNDNIGSIKKGQWLEIPLADYEGLKSSVRVKVFEAKDGADQLLLRSAFVNRGYPQNVLNEVETQLGAARGWPSLGAYFTGQIDEETLKEEIDQEVNYVLDIFEDRLDKGYDLLVMDYPRIDRYGHIFSLDFSQKHAPEAFQAMEKDLELLVKKAQSHGYRVLIQSGHGFSAVHTQINLSNAMESLVPGSQSVARGIPGKVSAQLYFNDQASAGQISEIVTALSAWKDSRNGSTIAEGVWSKAQMAALGMDHEDAGDLFVLLKPGYVFAPNPNSDGPLFSPATFKGDHGYAVSYPESRGVFIHPGNELHKESFHITDLAPMIMDYLKIEGPHSGKD